MSSTQRAQSEATVLHQLSEDLNGSGREQVAEIQRVRILAAMVDVASELGAGNATVARVVARSGVSRRTFYEIFEDREDCFLAAFYEAVLQIRACVLPAYEQRGSWRSKIRAALAALLEYFDGEPATARLVIVETLGAGPRILERRRQVLEAIVAIVDQGRGKVQKGDGPSSLTAEGTVGGVCALLHSRLLANSGDPLLEILNPLMSMIVLPYLGAAAARRELTESVPAPMGTAKSEMGSLRDLEMRLTYRTMRALLAIAAHPGASNRLIAEASGVRDQGQISKLLARLEHLELVENSSSPRSNGEPNRWTLTERGTAVFHAISVPSGIV